MGDNELTEIIRGIRERVRARHPEGSIGIGDVVLPDLNPLLHARDAAEAKVAAIGTVNPRPGGILNSAVQAVKRMISRALDWHVREQVEFNSAVLRCVQANLEALTESNRALAALGAHLLEFRESARADLAEHQRFTREEMQLLAQEARELKDIRAHWAQWREAFEERRSASEIHMLRTISELQGSFQQRVNLLEQSFRRQHGDFENALARTTMEVQQRVWADFERMRAEYDRVIHAELRVIRQRASAHPNAELPAAPVSGDLPAVHRAPAIDWLRFAERFRGSEERIRERHERYAAMFRNAGEVLDLGCGRGEFLAAARQAGVEARGVDASADLVNLCRARELDAEHADIFTHLAGLEEESLGGVFCSQVIEHLEPFRLPDLVQLISSRVRKGGLAIFETPNPECLAIFATHFYLDPTHTRPVPPALMAFYLEEAGFGNIQVQRMESPEGIAGLPESFRQMFFSGLDYSISAIKL